MNKKTKITAILLALMCVPLCGAWGAATAEPRYTGGQAISAYANEVIAYTSKTVVEDIATANNAPLYTPIDGLPNSCGAVAGAITVGFYDKYYPDLIPGWNSAYSSGRYRNQDSRYVPEAMRNLYTQMKTNSTGDGVTQSEYQNGLKTYVNSKGYSISFDLIGNGTNFYYDKFKSHIKNNVVTTLFVQPSYLYTFLSGSGVDTIESNFISGNHIMIAYGYYEVRYSLKDGKIKTDTYLKVATGIRNIENMYYKLGSYVDAAYIVNIS